MTAYIESHWRRKARPIIERVLAETKGQDEKMIRRALRDAYPFGLRKYHPYKIWCDEIRLQTGKKQTNRPCAEHVYSDTMGGARKCLRCGQPSPDLVGQGRLEVLS